MSDVQACVGDSAERGLDDLVFAVADRNLGEVERTLGRVLQEGTSWVAALRAAARHFERLHLVAGLERGGAKAESAMARLRPPVFWRHRTRFQRQVELWSHPQLAAVLSRLCEAELKPETRQPARHRRPVNVLTMWKSRKGGILYLTRQQGRLDHQKPDPVVPRQIARPPSDFHLRKLAAQVFHAERISSLSG